jgi:hypothetical protein
MLSIYSVLVGGLIGTISSNTFAEEAIDQIQIGAHWEKITDEELDELRGGFMLPNGLVVDFSFGKRIYQNGLETFNSYFELPKDVELSLDRIGGSIQASNFTNMVLNSITQNRLDNQVIKTINTIGIDISNVKNANFSVNSTDVFRDLVSPTYK